MKTEFPEVTANIVFLGALLGALARPIGGMLSDRFGGARVTIAAFATMALGVISVIVAVRAESFLGFLGSFLVLFIAAGMGNGSTYRMIPAVFQLGVADHEASLAGRRAAAGCIGIAGAIGSLGGFFIPRIFAGLGIEGGFIAFLAAYVVMSGSARPVRRAMPASSSAMRNSGRRIVCVSWSCFMPSGS